MNKQRLRMFASTLALALTLFVLDVPVSAQCSDVIVGLRQPLGATLTNQDNLLVSETGTVALHSGRISIVDAKGNRRTLLDGLPSAINDVNEPSGPAGIFMRGRTLYVAIGTGDAGRAGPAPGTTIPNPNPISSPIFSSILGIQFSAKTEDTTTGFTLTTADQQSLANGGTVVLSDGADGTLRIRLVTDFPNYVSNPLPQFAGNVQLSNPFGLVPVDDALYVTDGGRNRVWQVDLLTGSHSTLVTFPAIQNPLFGIVPAGGPFLDAVPTGIAAFNGKLLVTLFRGVPFPPGTSTVQEIDPATATQSALIAGRKSAIDVLPLSDDFDLDYLVLQHASAGPFFGSPGQVLRFENPTDPPSVLTDCLVRPTTMTLNRKTATLYVTEYGGRLVAVNMNL
ncbi:MAG TPA: ScyD/ScyE family protein [Pyrinomonadaceae bacterium]|nr:ScyD/ScyE family protein [Pyrinomonadaceae bacterium]